jgi:hypothetical protein
MGIVGVGDEPLGEIRARAGDAREQRGDPAAGAGLCDRDRLLGGRERVADAFLDRRVVGLRHGSSDGSGSYSRWASGRA